MLRKLLAILGKNLKQLVHSKKSSLIIIIAPLLIILLVGIALSNVGLREIIGQNEVPKLYSILKKRDIVIDNQTWNRRYREYMDKIKTGSVFEVAEVFRDLLMLREEKELSFGERKMLDTARGLLVKEISLAKNVAEKQIEKDLDSIFSQNTM